MGSVVVKGRYDSAASTNVTVARTNTVAGHVTVTRCLGSSMVVFLVYSMK